MKPAIALSSILGVLFLASSCKEESKPKDSVDKPVTEKAAKEPESTPGDDKDKPPADKPPTPTADEAPRGAATFSTADACTDPCLRLVKGSYDKLVESAAFEATEGLCKPCKGAAKKTCESQKLGCGSFDYFRNCIYAAHGYPFKKAKWQKVFAKKSWYKKNDSFAESDLSKTAALNVGILKWEARGCTANVKYETLGRKKSITLTADLDGDGKPETIEVTTKDVTIAGKKSAPIKGEGISEAAIVDIIKKDKRKELLVRSYESEDYYEHSIVTYAKGKVQVSSKTLGAGELDFPGDGKIVDRSANCSQRYWSEHTYNGKTFKQTKKLTLGKLDERTCAACPYVYAVVDGKERYLGEILRNVRGQAMATTQSLKLPRLGSAVSTIVITEEKDEITYLDHIYVDTATGRLSPESCQTSGATPAYCAADGRHLVLEKGQRLELSFPTSKQTGAIETVWATGYYVPIEPRSHATR